MKLTYLWAAAFASTALLFSGCGKKDDGAAAADASAPAPMPDRPKSASTGAESIPGENEVRQAMASKDYNGAVQKYVALKAAVATPEQNAEYASLFGQLRSDLMDVAGTDPKAAEALATLRAIRSGR